MKYIEVESLGEAWLNSINLLLSDGNMFYDEDKKILEICNLYYSIKNAVHEDAILKNLADANRIELMQKKYSTCGLVGDYKIDYGSYLYNNNNIDQIEWVIKKLECKIESKSATISLHVPGEDRLTCLSLLDFKIRDNKLIMNVVYRSQNIFSSQPGNILALKNIQQNISDRLNIECGNIELVGFSAHIYEDDIESAREVLNTYSNK